MGTQSVISAEPTLSANAIQASSDFEIVKAVLINGEVYHTVPEAARLVGVVPMTMFRWVTGETPSPVPLEALQNRSSRHYYVKAASVRSLREQRFQKV